MGEGGGGARMASCDVFMPQVNLHARMDRDAAGLGTEGDGTMEKLCGKGREEGRDGGRDTVN